MVVSQAQHVGNCELEGVGKLGIVRGRWQQKSHAPQIKGEERLTCGRLMFGRAL